MKNMKKIQKLLDRIFYEDEPEQLSLPEPTVEPIRMKHAAEPIVLKPEETPVKQTAPSAKRAIGRNNFDINLNEPYRHKINDKPEEFHRIPVSNRKYVSRPALSPIFGEIKEQNPKKDVFKALGNNTLSNNSPSKIGTVLSPIYGSLVYEEEKELFPEVQKIGDKPEEKTDIERLFGDKKLDDLIAKPQTEPAGGLVSERKFDPQEYRHLKQ